MSGIEVGGGQHYVLGRNEEETGRLARQHELWGPVTDAFLDRVGVPVGGRVAELGCGPGLMLGSLVERVGDEGSVEAMDASGEWLGWIGERARRAGWENLETRRVDLRELELEEGAYDVLFARWVFSFLPDVEEVVARLARALKPGGVMMIEDYNHYGVSAYPRSEGFERMIESTRAMYRSEGGDPFVAGRVPVAMAAAGLDLVDVTPTVKCGGPGSGVFQWGHDFFTSAQQLDAMQARGGLSDGDRALFLKEWERICATPGAMFYSPIVLDVAGRRRE